MTELPIDTLIIIGLVIASFVGKFFQKKEGEKPKRTVGRTPTGDPPPTIEDALREAWQKATQPQETGDAYESSPPPIPVELTEDQLAVPPLMEEMPTDLHPVEATPVREKPAVKRDFPITERKPYSQAKQKRGVGPQTNYSWVKDELLGGSGSLKKAIILKEILDQPKSLRSS